ncbi:MAG TPA: ribose-5-phosphate isomerase RpiA [Stellaceae bacterium]|nr:ribose-5-phosphate isomerase RpiA [Stellaceae bacterium]
MNPAPDIEAMKREAAVRAVAAVEDGMVLGLGSGSTTAHAVAALASRIAGGLHVACVATSRRTAALARRHGVPLTDFAAHRRLDLAIDGADQVETGTLDLVKGLGGALLREKIVACASRRFYVIVDETKLVARLGARTPVPVEIVRFGWETVIDRLAALGCAPSLRAAGDAPFVTENGNYIADCAFAAIDAAAALEARIAAIAGVVESGLFVGLASRAYVGRPHGVEVIERR